MKCAVVTGAAQGIGRTTAEKLAEAGHALALIDLRIPEATLDSLRSLGAPCWAQVGDITDERVVETFEKEVFGRFGTAHVLVNNAGISCISPAEDLSAA